MEFEYVTAEQCATHARMLEDGLAFFGITVSKSSDLGKMIDALEWMGSFPADAVQPDAAFAADKRKALRAFPLYEQAQRIARALTWARSIPGAKDKVIRLKKRLNRLETQDVGAQDYLFELEIAERLVGQGLKVFFDEPDIVVHFTEEKLGLACKRPRNVARLRERIREAADQVARQPFQGVIIMGVEALFHKSGDPKRPTITYLADQGRLVARATEILDEAIARARPDIVAAFQKGAAGILFCGIATAWNQKFQDGKSAYFYQWMHRSIPHPYAVGLIEALEARLFPDSTPP
jgi:hypothetical protein